MVVQEVDRVVARVRARQNEQHDALNPVQTFVNAHMQVSVHCWCLRFVFLAALLPACYAHMLAAQLSVNAQQVHPPDFVQVPAVPCPQLTWLVWLAYTELYNSATITVMFIQSIQ